MNEQLELFYTNISYAGNKPETFYHLGSMGDVILYHGEKSNNTISRNTIEDILKNEITK